jgi:hypothetical protein
VTLEARAPSRANIVTGNMSQAPVWGAEAAAASGAALIDRVSHPCE